LAVCAEDADPVGVLISQEKLAPLVKGNAGNPDKLGFVYSPLAELVNVIPIFSAFGYPHCLTLVGIAPAGYVKQTVRAKGERHRAAEPGLSG
jgi:hypothetical protein